jgi:hypothetical protein
MARVEPDGIEGLNCRYSSRGYMGVLAALCSKCFRRANQGYPIHFRVVVDSSLYAGLYRQISVTHCEAGH